MTNPEPTPAEIEAAAREFNLAINNEYKKAHGSPSDVCARALIALRAKDKARIAELEAALRECLGQAEGCWLNHYGDNPEGSPVPTHIARARAALAAAPEARK